MRVDHGQRPPAHAHTHEDEGPLGASDPGAVVLDIGGRAGALVVITPARLHGAEIEIHPTGTPWTGAHTAVRERRAGERAHYAGVFPRLDAGDYELRVLGAADGVVVPIAVSPGEVVETWLDAPVD